MQHNLKRSAMIKTVKFISQMEVEHHEIPSPNTAIISICAPGSKARIKNGFNAVLRLWFDDLYEENIHECVGAIPDLNGDKGVFWHNLRLPDANHAKAIIDFLNSLDERCDHITVHCHAGISRSAAVAQFISEAYGAELLKDTKFANKRVLRLLRKCHTGEILTSGSFAPSGEMATVGDFEYEWLQSQDKS
jgi:predicted protein tyrosine phosphatase